MKAAELMLGDWVYLYTYDEDGKEKRYTGKVSAISEYDNLGLNGDCNFMYEVEHCDEDYSESAMPIPLTPEILEKNGWEKSIGENPVEVWAIGKGTYLHKTDNGYKLREGAEFNVPNIQYIHTLQHALRLCGLDELADNIQI